MKNMLCDSGEMRKIKELRAFGAIGFGVIEGIVEVILQSRGNTNGLLSFFDNCCAAPFSQHDGLEQNRIRSDGSWEDALGRR
jgi:hypothetical protein